MLEVKNLTKVYDGDVRALKNVSFNVEQGEFLAVIGLSGSGKSGEKDMVSFGISLDKVKIRTS